MKAIQLVARWFGYERVCIMDFDGELSFHWARMTTFGLTCRRYAFVSSSVCLLLDGGRIKGPSYVEEWRAVA